MKHYAAVLLVHLLVHGVAPASAEVPVFVARDAATYVGTTSADVDVDTNGVVATEDNGLTVTFGTDFSSRIRDTHAEKCGDSNSDECKKAMQDVLGLNPSADGVQKRIIGVIAVLGAVALAHVVLEAILLYEETRQPEKIQVTIPQDQKDEISAWPPSDEFSFDPVGGDPFSVNMNIDPLSYQAAEVPSATKEENGDIVLSVGSLGPTIETAFSQALCERSLTKRALVKRALTVGCVAARIRRLMLLFQPGGQLQDFRYIDPTNFQFPEPIDQSMLSEVLGQTQDFADDLYFPNTSPDVRKATHRLSAWVALSDSIFDPDGKMTFSADFLEHQEVEGDGEEEEEGSTECPTGEYVPFCGNCGGDTKSASSGMDQGECKGVTDADDDYYKGCACIVDPVNGPYTLPKDLSAFQTVVDNGGEEPGDTSGGEDSGADKNAALSIILEKDGDDYTWVFYQTPRGEGAGCTTDKRVVYRSPTFQGGSIDEPGYPGGDYNFDVWGRACKWRGDGASAGELICDDERFGCSDPSGAATTTCESPSAKQQHEGAFCEFVGKADGSMSQSNPYTTGWCKVDFWHDFNMAGTIGAKTKMRVYSIKDRTDKDLGGSWGGPSDAGDVIGNEQEIILESALPHTLRIIPHKWGDNGIWNYRKKFDLDYNGQMWNEGTTDLSTGHCEESIRLSAAENGGNRYKFGWYCYFQC